MKVDEAMPLLEKACGVPFGKLFPPTELDWLRNKGQVGQFLLKHIGLELNSDRCDFEDGELKTNKAHPDGQPRETMWIMQIASVIDTLLRPRPVPFGESELYLKIRNIVYLPVVKNSDNPKDWYFVRCIRARAKPGSALFRAYEADYNTICSGLRHHVLKGDGRIHTTNGELIQVRSKDSKPYHPIVSKELQRQVANKNHGFYFTKAFLQAAVSGSLP